ncbi:MAG TPA: 30S ribosomal protein S4e, partial [Terriglobales bacterium]|nr:30S ribosomal protein S4e [Terriglobales bacterium]
MTNKGGARHLKRLVAPEYWPIHRKEAPWAPKPNPGAHKSSQCLPLELIVRDELGLARNRREASKTLASGKVKVDGKSRIERDYPTGLMDVVEFTDANLAYRVLPVKGKGLSIIRITKEEAKFKLCKILRRTTARGNQVQYGTHDGRSITPQAAEGGGLASYSTNDTLRISIPTQRVLTHIKFEKGNYAVVTAGRNLGRSGKIVELQSGTATRPAMVSIED